MKYFDEYAGKISDAASPYIKRTGEFFSSAGESARDLYLSKKKKRERDMRRENMKAVWQDALKIAGIVMIIVSVCSLLAALIEFVIDKTYCSKHKLADPDDDTISGSDNLDGSDNDEDEASAVKERKTRQRPKKERNNGYITL